MKTTDANGYLSGLATTYSLIVEKLTKAQRDDKRRPQLHRFTINGKEILAKDKKSAIKKARKLKSK